MHGQLFQWLQLHATKENGEHFSVWILTNQYPLATIMEARKSVARYILQEGGKKAVEFRRRYAGGAALPMLGAWEYLFPQPVEATSSVLLSDRMRCLGHAYTLEKRVKTEPASPPDHAAVLELLSDAFIGVPHNTRQKDGGRRYDDSDYEYVRLTRTDYNEMIQAGMNCFRVDLEQAGWIENLPVFYWGISGKDIQYPEHLYRSNYLGPILFLDEPGVCTRDHVIRPRLRSDPAFRKSITPQICFEEFQKYFDEAKNRKNPTALIQSLADRNDADIGDMNFLQQNLYTWETLASTALYQLAEDKTGPPSAIVFEPPGRIGSRRTLPEMNMAYLCQIPVDRPGNFTDIIYGFLRGAARAANKSWGTSIYGSVSRNDAFWHLTHAYDLGAQWFMFWDTHRLACVPYEECLALSRNLRNHIDNHPYRDMKKLKKAAEIALLFPAGYNLGHVHMGKGNLWGVGELNLERANRHGVKYRTVMGNLFAEIERCLRFGIAFDLFWDLPAFQPDGYREIVRIREDGRVEVEEGGKRLVHDGPRTPARPGGDPPRIAVDVSTEEGSVPLEMTARARLNEGSSLIYYTSGANKNGVYVNSKVFWELYGPEEEDYRILSHEFRDADIQDHGSRSTVEITFRIEGPGVYRLRASTCDLAGRTAVDWKTIKAASSF